MKVAAFVTLLASGSALQAQAQSIVQLPAGFKIEKVVGGLTYPTSITWDDRGQMYVAEAGGAFLEEAAPARIVRIENGRAIEVANLGQKGIMAAVTGLAWNRGAFYFTHRDSRDRTGAVSRMTPDGRVTMLFSGIIDSQTDHQPNDIRVGPDGRMYVTSGAGGNSAVMGQDMLPFITKNPETRTTSARDIVLTGQNFQTPDFRTPQQGDTVLTGAFVPFGTPTTPGQVIKGRTKSGGTILVFDPNNAEATLRPYAWGFRNVIGLAWNRQGEMFATQNGYDVFGSRPVKDEYDPTYRVREGAWYGWPDFSAALEPLTDPKFTPPGQLMAPVFVNGVMQEKKLGFLIDHAASGLTPPDKSLIAGLHPVNSSPSKPDIAPASWGDMAGQLFVPEWGDMAWVTNALRDKPAGNRIVRIDPATRRLEAFATNLKPGPASEQGAPGRGIERPFDVKFGPDGAMYIVDFGQHKINMARIADGKLPFEWPPNTGGVWKVTRG
ncbi:MAG: sugar dehydrogenase [Armatimonadetes bacterium]|nr:sugar dehydrogenase [Armatimonadota bacterium]